MSTDFYQIAYEHATNEIAEIDPQIERLARRKHLLKKLLEPLKLLVPESDPIEMSNCYRNVYEHANNEIAEIDAQIGKLIRRGELLEKLLEPLKLLDYEPDAAMPATASNQSKVEFSAPEAAAETSTVVLVEVPEAELGSPEAPEAIALSEAEETNVHARNGRSFSLEDIAGLAYRFWDERGRLHGHHEDDWFRAAQELQSPAY